MFLVSLVHSIELLPIENRLPIISPSLFHIDDNFKAVVLLDLLAPRGVCVMFLLPLN